MSASNFTSEYIRLDRSGPIAEVVLNRPKNLNTMDDGFFVDVARAFAEVEADPEVRVAVLWAEGKVFTAGLDLIAVGPALMQGQNSEGSRAGQSGHLLKLIKRWQESFSKLQQCKKPVIAAIHSHCIGGGVDLVTACDVRLCTSDTQFSIKETKLAIVADLGTLQRISRLTSRGFAREMAFTGEPVSAARAMKFGLVNEVYDTKEALLEGARKMAASIAQNSPLVVQATKHTLNYADEHSVQDGLDQVAQWNTAFLLSDDLQEAVASFAEKRKPIYKSKL